MSFSLQLHILDDSEKLVPVAREVGSLAVSRQVWHIVNKLSTFEMQMRWDSVELSIRDPTEEHGYGNFELFTNALAKIKELRLDIGRQVRLICEYPTPLQALRPPVTNLRALTVRVLSADQLQIIDFFHEGLEELEILLGDSTWAEDEAEDELLRSPKPSSWDLRKLRKLRIDSDHCNDFALHRLLCGIIDICPLLESIVLRPFHVDTYRSAISLLQRTNPPITSAEFSFKNSIAYGDHDLFIALLEALPSLTILHLSNACPVSQPEIVIGALTVEHAGSFQLVPRLQEFILSGGFIDVDSVRCFTIARWNAAQRMFRRVVLHDCNYYVDETRRSLCRSGLVEYDSNSNIDIPDIWKDLVESFQGGLEFVISSEYDPFIIDEE